jgi:hypothetical protein
MSETKYYCKGCDNIMERDKYFSKYFHGISYCTVYSKKVKLEKVSSEVAETYNLILKYKPL